MMGGMSVSVMNKKHKLLDSIVLVDSTYLVQVEGWNKNERILLIKNRQTERMKIVWLYEFGRFD